MFLHVKIEAHALSKGMSLNAYIVGLIEKDMQTQQERLSRAEATAEALMTAGIIQGDGSAPQGNGDVIDLTHDQVRTLVFCYRGGAFDARLRAAGLETAVR